MAGSSFQVLGTGMFAKVARLVGHPEWIDDPRFRTDNDRAENGAALCLRA